VSYYRRGHALGDAVTESTSTGTPSSTISGGLPGSGAPSVQIITAIAQKAIQQAGAARFTSLRQSASPTAQAQQAAVQQAAAAGAASQVACAQLFPSDLVAQRFCTESAQVLSGDALVGNVQAKVACNQLIDTGALDDSQRQDCVTCAMQQLATPPGRIDMTPDANGVPKLAQLTVDYEAAKAYALGAKSASWFAKNKIVVFAAGGGVLSLLVAALILKGGHRATTAAAPAVKANRRRRTRRTR
jgi:hypothetical protein